MSRYTIGIDLGTTHCELSYYELNAAAPRTWQESLRAWLVALKKHADRYPFMPSIIGIS